VRACSNGRAASACASSAVRKRRSASLSSSERSARQCRTTARAQPASLLYDGLAVQADFFVTAGELVPFVLSRHHSHEAARAPLDPWRAPPPSRPRAD
jgi:hypothetical protein